MRRRRRLLLGAGLVALLGAAGLFTWLWNDQPYEPVAVGINLKGYSCIRLGMTLAQVEKVLGKPAGYLEPYGYIRGIGTTWDDKAEGKLKPYVKIKTWEGREARITVHFDLDAKAVYKEYNP